METFWQSRENCSTERRPMVKLCNFFLLCSEAQVFATFCHQISAVAHEDVLLLMSQPQQD